VPGSSQVCHSDPCSWVKANDSSTPLLQDWLGDDKEKRFRREVHFPTGRFGEAIEQAHAVIFLASDESSFVNAADFVVDGGLTKAYVTPEGPATEAPKNLGS
jgi:NAD(P)-dependent dehydrogenase (short-subunit alcohol dehydrogenase family)